MCQIYSKLTIKIPRGHLYEHITVNIVAFKQMMVEPQKI